MQTLKIFVCDDCTIALANNDYSGMPDDIAETVKSAVLRLGIAFYDGDEIEFSRASCDCCGTPLHGRRTTFQKVAV